MSTEQQPSRKACGALFVLAACGAALAGRLTTLHFAFQRGDFVHAPACGGSGFFNCHLVSLSQQASVLGRPIAMWGAVLYAVWLVLAVVGWSGSSAQRTAALRLTAVSALMALVVDVYLGWVMVAWLHAVCLWCVATYIINALVFVATWVALRRARASLADMPNDLWLLLPWIPPADGARTVPVLVGAWMISLVAAVLGVTEVTRQFTQMGLADLPKQVRQYVQHQAPVDVPVAGVPVHGDGARVTIVEFSDFLCPACQRSVTTTKAMLLNHPKDVRVLFKHYPLSIACNPYVERDVHPHACELAAAAACAGAQGQFWPMHDLIYARSPKYDPAWLPEDARRAGLDMARWQQCLDSGEGMAVVKQDVEDAHRLGVTSTPTFFINGYLFGGAMPPAAFEQIVQEFLAPTPAPHAP